MFYRFSLLIISLVLIVAACSSEVSIPEEEEVSMRIFINQEEINTTDETLCWGDCQEEKLVEDGLNIIEEIDSQEIIDVQRGDEVTISFDNEERAADNLAYGNSVNSTFTEQSIEGQTFDILGPVGEQTYVIHAGWGDVDDEERGLKNSAFKVNVE